MTEFLLNMVERIGNNKEFWSGEKKEGSRNDGKKEKVGSTNIRNMAVLANNADCYEELKLFVEYKIAKGNGWDRKFDGDKVFGDKILECMEKIYEKCENEREALKNISKFFGYLYWKVCAIEKGKTAR